MTAAQHYQSWINIPFAIDRDSAEVRGILRSMMIVEKAVVTIVFAWLTAAVVRTALGRAHGLGRAFPPLTMVLIFVPLIVYSLKLLRLRK